MRHLIIIFFALLGLSACQTTKESIQQLTDIRDSIRIKDSVRIKDSTVTKLSIIDSLRIKDSTVIVQDEKGNVIYKEKWRDTEHINHKSDSTAFYKAVAQAAIDERNKTIQEMKDNKTVVEKRPSIFARVRQGFWFLVLGFIIAWLIKLKNRK